MSDTLQEAGSRRPRQPCDLPRQGPGGDMEPGLHGCAVRRPAFTLVEILATLMLVAIILPVAMSGLSLALNVADDSKRQTEAASLAQAKMAEIVACGEWQTASLAGDFSPDRPQYRWSAQVTDWQGATIKQLDVQVLWNYRNQDHRIVLTTLIYTGDSL